MLDIFGYICSGLMGLILGLTGAGGSILTVPILVYLFKIPVIQATGYGLFIVGLSSLSGVWGYFKEKNIDFQVGLIFGIPSLLGVIIARMWLLPALPDPLLKTPWLFKKDTFILVFFALMILVSAISMLKGRPKTQTAPPSHTLKSAFFLSVQGLIVGVLSGFVGAGGGFMIIPVLVFLAKLDMKIAIGTNLFIIALKSLIGLVGDLNAGYTWDWVFIGLFCLIAVFGVVVGTWLSKYISNEKLKPLFGWFTLLMGIGIFIKEIAFQ